MLCCMPGFRQLCNKIQRRALPQFLWREVNRLQTCDSFSDEEPTSVNSEQPIDADRQLPAGNAGVNLMKA